MRYLSATNRGVALKPAEPNQLAGTSKAVVNASAQGVIQTKLAEGHDLQTGLML